MRTMISCTLFLVIGCGHNDRPKNVAKPAQLEIVKNHVDLGAVFLRPEPMQVDVLLKNVGERDLHITELKPSCTCTKVVLDGDTVLAAKQTTLSVLLTVNEPGRHSASITVGSDSETGNSQVVSIYWTGVAPMECEHHTIDFGNVLPGQIIDRTVRFTRKNPQCRFVSLIPLADELTVGVVQDQVEFIEAPLKLATGDRSGRRIAPVGGSHS